MNGVGALRQVVIVNIFQIVYGRKRTSVYVKSQLVGLIKAVRIVPMCSEGMFSGRLILVVQLFPILILGQAFVCKAVRKLCRHAVLPLSFHCGLKAQHRISRQIDVRKMGDGV